MRVWALPVGIMILLAFAIAPPRSVEGKEGDPFSDNYPANLCALCASAVSSDSALRISVLRPSHAAFEVIEQSVAPRFPETAEFALRTSGFLAERAELNYKVVGEAVTVGVDAGLAEAAEEVDTNVNLDLRVNYIPPGAEVTYYWTLTSPDGESVETPVKTFQMEDEGFDWRELTDDQDRVRVHWYDGDTSFGENLLSTATRALDRLEEQTGATLERRTEIWVYANRDELFEALPLHQPEWVGGQAYPALGVVLAAIGDDRFADQEIRRSIPHEISHLLLYQATKNPYNSPPSWLDEGLAVHSQEVPNPGGEEALREAAEGGWLTPLKTLSGSFGADEEDALLAYEQSGSVVAFILEDPRYGADDLSKVVAAFKEGVTYDDALKAGLGITTDQLDEQWRDSLPYEVAPPGSGQRPSSNQGVIPDWARTFMCFVLGALATLFLAGGLVTIWAVGRRKSETRNAKRES